MLHAVRCFDSTLEICYKCIVAVKAMNTKINNQGLNMNVPKICNRLAWEGKDYLHHWWTPHLFACPELHHWACRFQCTIEIISGVQQFYNRNRFTIKLCFSTSIKREKWDYGICRDRIVPECSSIQLWGLCEIEEAQSEQLTSQRCGDCYPRYLSRNKNHLETCKSQPLTCK